MGYVGQAGEQAANVARNAILSSKLLESVPGTWVDRQCGSSRQALHFAAQAVMSGTMDCVIAAGVESMSYVPMGMPMLLPAKNGMGFYVSPGMQKRNPGVEFSQFAAAEMIVKKYGLQLELQRVPRSVLRFVSLAHLSFSMKAFSASAMEYVFQGQVQTWHRSKGRRPTTQPTTLSACSVQPHGFDRSDRRS